MEGCEEGRGRRAAGAAVVAVAAVPSRASPWQPPPAGPPRALSARRTADRLRADRPPQLGALRESRRGGAPSGVERKAPSSRGSREVRRL